MAMAMWAKSAAGTNLGFIKDFGRIIKSWREILQSTLQRKQVPFRTKIQGLEGNRSEARDKCLYQLQPTLPYRSVNSFQSRIFQHVFSRTAAGTLGSQLRGQTALRLSSGSGRSFRNLPILSLVGVTLGVNLTSVMDDGSERMMSQLQDNFRSYSWQTEPLEKVPTCLDDLHINEKSIANGCEGAVFKARVKSDRAVGTVTEHQAEAGEAYVRDADYDLALKAVFNYGAESNAHSILQELEREVVPLRPEGCQLETPLSKRVGRLPPHPNIVDMPGIFVDDMLVTEEGLREFPAAMPHRLDPEHFYGHNKTLYLVMRRRSTHLRDFLSMEHPITMATRCHILAQLLEGVAHLSQHGIAHRDLKADNILVDLPPHGGPPRVEICDFGCCLAEESKSMRIPFPSRDMYLGGNSWLMAPEISTAVPGPRSVLDFRKSDLWAVGALAYEILGADNPFYPSRKNSGQQLNSRTYREEELPSLPEDVPAPVRRVVKAMLSREPYKRPAVSVAASVVQMVTLTSKSSTSALPAFPQANQESPSPDSLHHQDRPQACVAHTKGVVRRHHRKRLARRHQRDLRMPGHTDESPHHVPPAVEACNRDRQWLNWILAQGLALVCQLTFGDKSQPWSTEAVMRFLFFSRLTYANFKEAMRFF